jgi:hypothetical protein
MTVELPAVKSGSNVSVKLTSGSVVFENPSLKVGADSTGAVTFNVPADFPSGPATLTVSGTEVSDREVSIPEISIPEISTSVSIPSDISTPEPVKDTITRGVAFARDVPVEINATCEGDTGTTTPSGDQRGGNLPRTGSDTGRLVGIGAALIVIGAAAVYGALRSKGQSAAGASTA